MEKGKGACFKGHHHSEELSTEANPERTEAIDGEHLQLYTVSLVFNPQGHSC